MKIWPRLCRFRITIDDYHKPLVQAPTPFECEHDYNCFSKGHTKGNYVEMKFAKPKSFSLKYISQHNKYGCIYLNSSPLSAAYIRQWIRSALFQILACRLFGAKPLSKPMLWLLSIWSLGINFSEIQYFLFMKTNASENIVCENKHNHVFALYKGAPHWNGTGIVPNPPHGR